MPMLLMLALTPVLLLDAIKTAAYVAADNADAGAKMPNVACHLVGALLCC
jgi:hypothetical protein